MGVVVGDPKMSPYANILHDVEIIDVRVQENVSINQTFDIEIAIQNIGQGEAVGQLKVMDKLGSIILANQSLVIPNGDMNGSRQILTLQMNSSREGWNNLVIRWDATSVLNPEREIDNNLFDLTLWVNTAPIIEDIFSINKLFSSTNERFTTGSWSEIWNVLRVRRSPSDVLSSMCNESRLEEVDNVKDAM